MAAPVWAQAVPEQTLNPVIVSASRFATDPASTPIGATVITAEQIRESGINNVNEAIRKIGGVYGRQNLNGTPDYALDLRGFGEFSEQNIVVMVDGIRLSANEQMGAVISAIPIESVERVEIVRGGSSVLYGAGATGGTIQIITKRGQPNVTRGSIMAGVGSHDYQELRTSLAKGWDQFSIDATIGALRTDNYRDNNRLKQENFNGGLEWNAKDARLGLRVDAGRQDGDLAGPLTYAEFQTDPRQSNSPGEYGKFDTDRFTLFGEKRFGKMELAGDLSHHTKDVDFFQFGALTTYRTKSTQFSPRIRHLSTLSGWDNEFVSGLDFSRSNRVRDASFAKDDATQRSEAIYFKNQISNGALQLAFGARHEKSKLTTVDPVPFNSNYSRSDSLNAWTLEGSYALQPAVQVFAKAGRSFRLPNVDDNAWLMEPLAPQTSRDLEIGTKVGNDRQNITVRAFQHRLQNEIFYDPFQFENVNLDPTRRRGAELEIHSRLSQDFSFNAVLQHVSAKFTDGPYSGKEMVLVPKNTATLRLNWQPGTTHSADVGVQWVDSQRYGGDFTNACSRRIPSFATVDARYAIRNGAWEFAVAGSNLTNKDYFTQAFGRCRDQAGPHIYPDAGRAIKFTARMDF